MKSSLNAKLKSLEQQFERLLANRPKDPLETNRALAALLGNIGIPPAQIGLDDRGREIAGFVDPPGFCPPSMPLNRPVLRFLRMIQEIKDVLARADDPATLAELDPAMQRELMAFDDTARRRCIGWCTDLLDVHRHQPGVAAAGHGGRR